MKEYTLVVDWIDAWKQLPVDESPVLAVVNGEVRIAAIFWETPGWEEGGQPFRYWDDPTNDGQGWDFFDVEYWMPFPKIPSPKTDEEKEAQYKIHEKNSDEFVLPKISEDK